MPDLNGPASALAESCLSWVQDVVFNADAESMGLKPITGLSRYVGRRGQNLIFIAAANQEFAGEAVIYKSARGQGKVAAAADTLRIRDPYAANEELGVEGKPAMFIKPVFPTRQVIGLRLTAIAAIMPMEPPRFADRAYFGRQIQVDKNAGAVEC